MLEILDQDTKKQQADLVEASNLQRCLNYLIDIVIYLMIIGSFLTLTGTEINDQYINLMFMGVYLFCSIFLEAIFSKTPGKFFTKTHVVNKNGMKPTLLNIVGRNLCRLIPFDALSFLFGRQGWHDQLSDTFVVKD